MGMAIDWRLLRCFGKWIIREQRMWGVVSLGGTEQSQIRAC